MTTEAWRSMDSATLDAAYNNSAAVPGSADMVEGWERRSAELRQTVPGRFDLPYGPGARQKIDLLSAGAGTPTLAFFPGGYWQSRSKDTFTFVAEGPLATGISVAIIGYTLAPEATMDGMVGEAGAALAFLRRALPDHGLPADGLVLSGWSAGAQLAAMVADRPGVRAGLLISGLYDLEPLRHSFVNLKLGLDEASARRNSPVHHVPAAGPPAWIACGGAERPEMRRQSRTFFERRADGGLAGGYREIAGANHFSILETLADPAGALTSILHDRVLL